MTRRGFVHMEAEEAIHRDDHPPQAHIAMLKTIVLTDAAFLFLECWATNLRKRFHNRKLSTGTEILKI